MEFEKQSKPKTKIFVRIFFCSLILIIGLMGMITMAKMKKPPAEVKANEKAVKVKTLNAVAEDVQVFIKGFGEVQPLNIVSIASEISGKIVQIHPKLEPGEIIEKGDLLFKIDPRNYQAAYNEAKARVRQNENSVKRLEKEYVLDKQRLKTLIRNRELAKAEFHRLKKLYQKDMVGTRSGVDQAEQTFNSARDLADQMSQDIEIYPIRIQENKAALESARAAMEIAKANLDRCEVKALFKGRIREAFIELGQYVNPGQNAVTIADDSILEILVSLDSRDVKQWLCFNKKKEQENQTWFSGIVNVDCKIKWTEDLNGHGWNGQLHRVVAFDPKTRTLTAAVRVKNLDAVSTKGLPLVEGMFCSVEIPGKKLKDIIRLPRWAVTFKNTVYMAKDNRLKTVPVNVARIEGEQAFISQGIKPGDSIIITRLIDPLENQLLEIIKSENRKDKS